LFLRNPSQIFFLLLIPFNPNIHRIPASLLLIPHQSQINHSPTGTRRQTVKKPAVAGGLFLILVARGGIEPPTQGFSIPFSTLNSSPMTAGLAALLKMPQNHV